MNNAAALPVSVCTNCAPKQYIQDAVITQPRARCFDLSSVYALEE